MKGRSFLDFVIEILLPLVIFVRVMPILTGPIWQNVESDPETTWYYLVTMHVLSVMIGVCWFQCYTYLRLGLFPPNRR